MVLDALVHRDEDIDSSLAHGIIGALREVLHHVIDSAGLSAPFFDLQGASTGAWRDCLGSPLRV
jgi:hypothetical protein